MIRIAVIAAIASIAAGCSSGPSTDDTGLRDTPSIDAPAECVAVCSTGLSSMCSCNLPCHGHVTTAACTGGTCSCTMDGASTFTYGFTECAPQAFIDGCSGLAPDAGHDAGAASDAGTDSGAPSP